MTELENVVKNIDIKAVPKAKTKKGLDELFSEKPLGSFVTNQRTIFRLFAPNAARVFVYIFHVPGEPVHDQFEMSMDEDGVWEACLMEDLSGKFYGYKILDEAHMWDGKDLPIAVDPYAKALTTFVDYLNPRLSIIYNDKYDWEGDNWIAINLRDLIIYEAHVKDMTSHESSKTKHAGTYKGLVESNTKGGINHIKELGANAVELLPTHEFSYYETPFQKEYGGKHNTWNPYEENHWGYMTAGYFAPAAKYAQPEGELADHTWVGKSAEQVTQFKDMVKGFHKEGIAVIMDVVFNHISEYELANLQVIDREYYLRKNEEGHLTNESWCGNDLASERPMMRRLIKDCIKYWMTEYHVDGFRFDLGKILDYQTLEEVLSEAKEINPNVIFIAEPWGGGYDPTGFSYRGWSTWNDQFRNGIKGENPYNGLGWLFCKNFGGKNKESIKNNIIGSLMGGRDGLYHSPEFSVNYLASHDGYTLGDFIRIACQSGYNEVTKGNVKQFVKLSEEQMQINKLAAILLLSSQGIVMIHEGQEFARTKVVRNDKYVDDPHTGKMDHNSYDKDNETNYLNYEHLEVNRELFEYYKGLIKLRKNHPLLKNAKPHQIKFHSTNNEFALAYSIKNNQEEFVFIVNTSEKNLEFTTPNNNYSLIVDANVSGTVPISTIDKIVIVSSKSGCVLYKKY
ncbi:MAG: pullulanase [Bacteroidetes bacterium]|nr:pullulanase [Bacteroidota bacterium]